MDFHTSKKKRYTKKNAYLMVELLVSLAIALILLQVLIPTLLASRNQMISKTQVLERIELKEAIVDHFQSQFESLLWRSCYTNRVDAAVNDDSSVEGIAQASLPNIMVQIGSSSETLPDRISNKALLASTDWLMATERAACRYSTRVPSLSFSIPYSCSWDEDDDVVFEACGHFAEGLLTNVTTTNSSLQFSDVSIVGQSGVIVGHKPYIWYAAEGKSEQHTGAFWRTPQYSGNSLELWSGIEKLAIYPLLDTDEDGIFDTLATNYQAYPLSKIKGLWLELIVNDTVCNAVSEEATNASYKTHRGENWAYHSSCALALQFVVGGS